MPFFFEIGHPAGGFEEIEILQHLTLQIHRPASETSRCFVDVVLGVATADTQRVQFHQLARVILIQTATWAPTEGGPQARSPGDP